MLPTSTSGRSELSRRVAGVMGEVLDDLAVEVSKAEEGLHLSFIRRFGPLCHSRDFHRVHLYMVFGYDQA